MVLDKGIWSIAPVDRTLRIYIPSFGNFFILPLNINYTFNKFSKNIHVLLFSLSLGLISHHITIIFLKVFNSKKQKFNFVIQL